MRIWTQDQKKAIETRGNLIVSAAAGAGKTAVLTERLTRIVASGTPVDRLLVLTFTRAAAAEMKQRIEKSLRDEAATAPDAAAQAYLRNQAGAVGRAYISTIDAFCARILRRHGHLIDLPPSVRVLDELETPVLSDRVRDALLTRLGAEESGDWLSLLRAFGSEDAAWAAVSGVAEFLQSQPHPERWLDDAVRNYTDEVWVRHALTMVVDGAREELKAALSVLIAARDALPPSHASAIGALDEDLLTLRGVLVQTTYDDYRAALFGYTPGRLSFPRGTEEADKADAKAARDAVKKCVSAQREQFMRTAAEETELLRRTGGVLLSLQAVVLAYLAAFAEEKRRIGAMDYADLEHMALQLLQIDAVAAEYRDRFDFIAVDEYQDSNRVQESLLHAIRRADNLFLVGDVKQSIYRFRQAEPSLFLEKLTTFSDEVALKSSGGLDATGDQPPLAAGSRIDLSSNFRSAPEVLGCVNDVFDAILTRETGEIDYDARARLVPALAGLSGGAELHLIERNAGPASPMDRPSDALSPDAQDLPDAAGSDDDNGKDGGAPSALEDALDAEVEARLAAQRIRELMAHATIPDHDSGAPRPLRFGDFAILLRTTGEAAHFAATLALAGIPCYAQMSGGYFDSVEVMLALNLLRVIDNRRQDIPLLSVMRSCAGDFTAEELVSIRTRTPEGTLFDALLAAGAPMEGAERPDGSAPPDPLAQKCAAFLARIETWRQESLLLSADALLSRLLDETGLYAQMGALVGGAQRQANLDALVSRARAFEGGQERGIASFLRFMDHAGQSSARLGAAQQISADVVRILTIHRSKGLEFPVVLLCQLGRRFNMDDQRKNLLLHSAGGIGLRWIDGGVQRDTAARRMLVRRQRKEQLAEEMRVLYVGMTRAQYRLILIGSWKNAGRLIDSVQTRPLPPQVLACAAPLQWTLMGTRAHCPTTLHEREAFLTREEARRTALAPVSAPDAASLDMLEVRLGWQYPFADAAALPAKAAVSAIVKSLAAAQTEGDAAQAVLPDPSATPGENGEETLAEDVFAALDRAGPSFETPVFARVAQERSAAIAFGSLRAAVQVPPSSAQATGFSYPSSPSAAPISAVERGTAVHAALSTLPLAPLKTEQVRAHCDALAMAGRLTPAQAASVPAATLAWLTRTPLWARMGESRRCERELPFSHLVPAAALFGVADTEEAVLLQGVIDCCFLTEAGWVLLDYKTDRMRPGVSTAQLAQSHAPQIRLYADALHRLTGLPVAEQYVVLLSAHAIEPI